MIGLGSDKNKTYMSIFLSSPDFVAVYALVCSQQQQLAAVGYSCEPNLITIVSRRNLLITSDSAVIFLLNQIIQSLYWCCDSGYCNLMMKFFNLLMNEFELTLIIEEYQLEHISGLL